MYYQDISHLDLKKYLKKRQDIIAPFGSVESHGDHLPYFTDTYAIDGIIFEFSRKNNIMIAPTIPYTITRNAEKRDGTATLEFESARNYFHDIFMSFARWGFKIIYPITYHASTQHLISISEAARETNKKFPKVNFRGIHLWNILRKVGKEEEILESKQGEVHAGEIETSLMMYFKPRLVKKSKLLDEKFSINKYDFICPLKQNRSGVYGQAKLGSKIKGKRLVQRTIKELEKLIMQK